MIVHVWRRAAAADIGPVVVACGDREIAAAVESAGGRAVMTDPDHASGSDRVCEAVRRVDPEERHDIVVNVQGDLPTVDPGAIAAALTPFAEPAVDISTLAVEIADDRERIDPNVVKAVIAEPASRPAFKYSAALQGLKGKPWTYDNLNAFLTKPKNYAKGTKMTFVGIKKPADRAHVIFYLRSLSATPAPLE